MPETSPLIEIKGLTKSFTASKRMFEKAAPVQALQGIDLSIRKGETLALVGESGCGKSTLGRCLLKLIEPSQGQIFFDGTDITGFSASRMKPYRKHMQIIFQDPYASLNPRFTIGQTLLEPLEIHGLYETKARRRERVGELLSLVGLPLSARDRYPHEFSGGQRQRVGIARALAVEPDFIVCDEPVSALDVSIQAQILNLLLDLQEKLGLTYLFISHDLRVVQYLSHRVAVMYLGKIVEIADCETLYQSPRHPYTRALLSAVPQVEGQGRKNRIVLSGEPPKPSCPPSGCHFHPRCFLAQPLCQQSEPVAREMENARHWVACHFA